MVYANTTAQKRSLLARADRLFRARADVMNEWIATTLPRVVAGGAVYAAHVLDAAPDTSSLMARVVEQIQQRTFGDVAASTDYLTEDARRFIQTVAHDSTSIAADRGLSIPEARDLVAARLEGNGIKAFVDRSGREWNLDSYSEMLMRTTTAHAYNTGTIIRSTELGVGAFEVFDGTGDEACAEANGSYVSAEWAFENTIAHPNCVRAFGPVPGFSGDFSDQDLAA